MSSLSNHEEEFSFIKEKIKDKPINKKRLAFYLIVCAMMAIVFGMGASFTFVITKPYFEGKFTQDKEPDEVSIPKDETDIDVTENAQSQAPIDSQNMEPTQTADNSVVIQEKELDLEDLESIYKQLSDVAKEADKSIVTVTGVTSEVDWFNETLENKGQASGVIVANNGQELLMLTNFEVVENVEQIRVTFCDGSTIEATAGKYDRNSQIAVVHVALDQIEESTMNEIKVAVLGNSYASHNGDFVIALGSPLGYSDSVTYGMITSTSKIVTTVDANYRLITTDALGSSIGSGVLINLDGDVIGFISPQYNIDNSIGLAALAISDLKAGIEKLTNDKSIVQLGVKGSDVTADISELQNLPVGVYVIETVMDSPAMNAGIQNGDVITMLGDVEVKTVRDLQNELNKYQPNQVIKVVVNRQGMDEYKEIQFVVTLGNMD